MHSEDVSQKTLNIRTRQIEILASALAFIADAPCQYMDGKECPLELNGAKPEPCCPDLGACWLKYSENRAFNEVEDGHVLEAEK